MCEVNKSSSGPGCSKLMLLDNVSLKFQICQYFFVEKM